MEFNDSTDGIQLGPRTKAGEAEKFCRLKTLPQLQLTERQTLT